MKKTRPLAKAILLSLFLALFALNSSAQKVTLSFQNETFEKVLNSIKQQTGLSLVYSEQLVNLNRKVSIKVNSIAVEDAMKQLLTGTNLSYEIKNNKLYLIENKNSEPKKAIGQSKKITGLVTDEKGEPIIGATVKIVGNNIGTVTDINGRYQIQADEKSKLNFSYVGFNTFTIDVNGRVVINIILKEDNKTLDEIVVVGYGTQRKINSTGAVSTVKSVDLVKSAFTNTTQTLAGRIPGLITKQVSGEPGNDYANLSIRGFGSALVIVDGIESSMNNIDPNEIESITVLKDASAAVYGARAGNGVILITTKRGSSSKPTISFNSMYSQQGLTQYPKMLEAGRYAELIREAQMNSGVAESSLRFTAEQVQKYKDGVESGYQSTNWFDEVMNKYSPMLQNNISLRGGSDAVKYYTYLGNMSQTGMYKSNDNKLQRYNIRTNIDAQINKNLSVGFDLSLIVSSLQSPIRSQSSLWQDLQESQPVYPAHLPDASKLAYTGMVISTIASTTRDLGGYDDVNRNELFSTFNLKYTVPGIKGLSLKGLVNYINNTWKSKRWEKQYTMYVYEPESDTYLPKAGATSTSLNEGYGETRSITSQISLNFERMFAGKHNVSALLLSEISSSNSLNISAARRGFTTTTIDYLFAGGAEDQFANGSASETGRLSYVGRLNYDYKSRYLFETTMRYDGSPKFATGKRWGFFPSVMGGWRISEESFLKENVSWLNNLKLRTSYSKAGYDGIGAFQYLTGYNFANRYIVENQIRTGLSTTGLSNPQITWEEMTIYNLGLDFSMFRGKLYGEIDAFYRDRQRILATRAVSVPSTFGASLPAENINAQNNRGFEIMIGHKNKINDFSYDFSANVSYARAKWTHYDEPDYTDPDDIRIKQVTGNWADRWFGYQSDGLFTTQEEITNYTLNQDNQGNATLKPGDIKYVDQNNDNKLDWRDYVQIGNSNTPQIMFGLNLSLSYKNFDLSVLGQGAAGYHYMLNLQLPNECNVPEIMYNLRWTEANNDKYAMVPRVYMGGKQNNNYTSDYWLYNASYFRIKTINLGYNLPKSLLTKLDISNLRLYFSGTNLFTFSKMSEFSIDPETSSGSRAGLGYPQQKVYSLGINLSF